MEPIKEKIRTFLSRVLRNHAVQDDEDIFALGYINSLFAMELVLFVEREFGITIDNEDLELDFFRSVNAIAALVERKLAANQPS